MVASRVRPQRAFTLLELLVVLVIGGIVLGLVSLNMMPGERQVMQREAQRIALLLQLARDEAIVRNRPIAFEIEREGYRFLLRNGDEWQLITGDESLRERRFSHGPVTFALNVPVAQQEDRLRIVFGREPVDKPFVLTFSVSDVSVSVRADGIGHFAVE